MTVLGIDHIVVAVADPDAAARTLEDRAGLCSTGGGRHEAHGTFNRLVWFGDSYLELIGVFDTVRAGSSWIGGPALGALAEGGGLVTWAIAVDDLDAAVASLRSSGARIEDPVAGERLRPDGRVVRWRLALAGPLGPDRPPFLIEHDAAAAEWTAGERAERGRFAHPIGGPVRLAALEVAGRDPASLAHQVASMIENGRARTGEAAEVLVGEQRFVARSGRSLPTVHLTVGAPVEPRAAHVAGCRFDLRPPA